MMATLKAEFRKLLSVRSTYIITGLVVALVIFFAFYIEGWRLTGPALHDPTQLAQAVTGALGTTVFCAIVAILLMTHEYRYNTIMYTLTSSNSRTKVLACKLIAISAYALFISALVGILSPTLVALGVHAHGHTLVPQTLHHGDLIWRSLFYGWGYGMAGLLLATLLRNQVASIAALFVIPDLGEQLLGLLLKHNTVYLPFNALNHVINNGMSDPHNGQLSPGKAAAVYSAYLIVGWLVAWILFLKRDAN